MTNNPLALVIEDDPGQSEIFSQALQLAGYEVRASDDGQAAIELLAATVPDLVVLDLRLPQVGGDKVLAAIRADERLAATRVILATANPRMAEPLRGESDLVLIKPISFSQLRNLAARLRLA